MQSWKTDTAEIHYQRSGDAGKAPVIWAHGWGQSHAGWDGLLHSLERAGDHYAVDFPGFGQSPAPGDVWGTEDYADHMAEFIRAVIGRPVLWIGHSFGCRVALQMAARHPDLISGMVFIGGAGLKRKRPLHKQIYIKARIALFKALKRLVPLKLVTQEWLLRKFGSADYANAGVLRGILVKVVNEDLSDQARRAACPTLLIYGENDTEAPPEIAKRLNNLIAGSELVILPAQDHYSVLGNGRHQVAPLLKKFIDAHNNEGA